MSKSVALVGLAFRFPGTDSRHYWSDLLNGKDCVTEVEPDRWSKDAYLHPAKEHPGTAYTFAAGSIGDVSGFDADFFGISPREAALMDPQQRLLLELCWESIESAGIKPSSLRGSDCGVFVGIASADYSYRMADDIATVDASMATGNTASIAANRLSYVFDLRGPSLAVDTACSSAMVAFHLACRAIANGEISHAIAGGVSLHLHPYGFITFSKASMLSPEGRCKVFDASGDGYVRSEGGGLFLLKDYDQAVADGDRILAVVAGTAVNTDGRKSGLTVPSVDAQTALMRQVYEQAGIPPDAIDYLEAHGTGTPVGDPIETRAIGQALGQRRPADAPLPIGSVKSNLGHLEAASGVAGLVKAVYSLQHRVVPGTIGIQEFNPNIRFEDWNIEVVTKPHPLRETGTLTIGVNSFGFGGANAHVILQSPAETGRATGTVSRPTAAAVPVVVTGRSADALQANARRLADMLRSHSAPALYDVAYAAALRRDWHDKRAVVFGADSESIAQLLDQIGADETANPAVHTGFGVRGAQGPVFVYSGNGSQWAGMGSKLLAHPVFGQSVADIDGLFVKLAGWSLKELFEGDARSDVYERTEIAQPALFAIQVGITRMLAAQGVQPTAVTGHSVGEVAAAWACGALTLADAITVIYHRSQQQGLTKGKGRMAAVGMDGAAAAALLDELGLQHALCVAGYNSTKGATLAGTVDALEKVAHVLAERRVFYKQLDLDYAFHSSAMDPIEAPLKQALAHIRPRRGDVPFFSTVEGAVLDGAALDADYWWRNIRVPVRFEQALDSLVSQGSDVLIEIGPAPVLRGYVNEMLKHHGKTGVCIPTGRRNDDAPAHVQAAVAQTIISGAPIDWAHFFPTGAARIELPPYAWQRERYWHPVTAESLNQLGRRRVHPLLGYKLSQQTQPAWENQLDTLLQPWLADHVVGHATVFPGSGFAEIALAAALQWYPGDYADIEELEIHAPLLLSAAPSKITRLSLDDSDGRFRLRSKQVGSTDPWTVHASGRLLSGANPQQLTETAPALPAREPDFTGETHLALTRAAELDYGPAFQAVSHGWLESPRDVVAVLHAPAALAASLPHSLLHPALLDCTFQLIIQMLKDDPSLGQGVAFVPTRIGRLRWRAGLGTPHRVRARLLKRAPHSLTAEFALFDEHGQQIAAISEARFRSVRLSKSHAEPLAFLDYVAIPSPHPQHLQQANPALRRDALQPALRAMVRSIVTDGLLERYAQEVDPLLETLCDRYAADALLTLSTNGRLEASVLTACRDAVPHAAPLLDWLLARTARRLADSPDWQIDVPQDYGASTADIWNSLLREYPDYFTLVHATGRIGLHLPALLSGEAAWANVCPRDISPVELAHYVLGDAASQRLSDTLGVHLEKALLARAPEQRVSILEIGAGASRVAAELCRHLDFAVADFGYASSEDAALEHAERLREHCPELSVERIDVNATSTRRDVDLIVFRGDFGSLEGARQALQYGANRLKPGGTLLLWGTQPAAWMDFIFGGNAAWWTKRADGTPGTPQRTAAYWQSELAQLGLDCDEPLELAPESACGPYLLAAGLPVEASAVAQPQVPQGGWLILADAHTAGESGAARKLADHLSSRHRLPVHVETDVMPEQLDALLQRAQVELGEIRGIVHLAGLASGANLDADDPQRLLQAQVQRCAVAAGLASASERAGLKTTLWLLTAGAAPFLPAAKADGYATLNDASLWLYGRTMINEAAGFDVRLVDLPQAAPVPLEALARELLWPDGEQEVALGAAGERYAPRLRKNPRPHAETPAAPASAADTALRLGFEVPGQLRNLRWEAHPLPDMREDELQIRVEATGLNFRDVMYTLGLLSDEAIENGFAGPTLGLEFSGVVERVGRKVTGYKAGDAVVGFGPASFGNVVVTQPSALSHIPRNLSFEAAATIPSTFFTVYYALHHLARLEPGERVLIHGAAGGVGIAAIQFAQWIGAEIHASAGSDEKRDFLRLMGVKHIYDSRSLDFADEILAATDGEGVDVVLNSLAGEAINRNLRALKPFGRFLELGKRDFYENTRIGLRPFRNNISYFGIDADQLMSKRPDLTRRLYGEMMALFEEGVLRPLPYHAFDANDIVDAFRHMQQARQIGKIVITYRRALHANASAPAAATAGELQLRDDASYLVTGGLSGFGLRTAQWLADKGARHLVLVSRSGPASDEAQEAIAALRERGVAVHAAPCDVTDRAALAALLAQVDAQMPPLRGIVHAAMVIDDGLVRGATAAQIERVMAPKIVGALHLDELTRALPLDFFVFHSSGTTLFGNPGQSNYVAANGWLEALARHRRARGLPATSPRWGAIADAGFLARNQKVKDALQNRMGGSALPAATALDALEDMLLAGTGDLGVLELDWRSLARFLPSAQTPKFAWVARDAATSHQDEDGGNDVAELLATLSDEELHPAVVDMIKHEVSEILRVPADKIDPDRSVYDMGLDSLMGVELVVALESRFGVRLPVMALSESPTMTKLATRLIEVLRGDEPAELDTVAQQVAHVVAQHTEDVSSEALAEFTDEIKAAQEAGHKPQRMIR
ncbi:type I polyketide synthase [Burkholderia multivorans]|uniref:type I polyketide synthase n=1 Tax=Burkholderia multivorans TaxID=87883 RepID=UPI000CFF5AFD|nr:type I polyketide synthase [Burkholderia multivorans]PRF36381.1 beta-ketoacyl synthase [Burkholderia multivorans]PRG82612.1 beta-ketoacyl synthase [Burkholderia multivorans]